MPCGVCVCGGGYGGGEGTGRRRRDDEVGEEVDLETVEILTSSGGGEQCDRGQRSTPNDG